MYVCLLWVPGQVGGPTPSRHNCGKCVALCLVLTAPTIKLRASVAALRIAPVRLIVSMCVCVEALLIAESLLKWQYTAHLELYILKIFAFTIPMVLMSERQS